MQLIYSYKNLHKELTNMINAATEYIYIFSWDLNIHYNKQIKHAIIDATIRKTHVYLITGGVVDNPVNINNLIGLNSKFFHLKCKFQIGPKRPFDIIQQLFNFQTKNDHMYYNHIRFALNDKTFLLGGVNSSLKYNGNLKQNMNLKNPFTWYDSGLKMDSTCDIMPFVNNLFTNMDYEMPREILNISSNIQLVHDNYYAYQNIINAIQTSKNRIYIENQYFVSHPDHTNNEISHTLGKRINKAIKEKEEFHVQFVLNYRNYDETNSVQLSMTTACIVSLYYMRSLCDCDDETFCKYVRICMPRDDIDIKCIIHSKIFIVDDSFCLYTTANIHDVSFANKGNMELALQFTDHTVVSSLYKQSIDHFNKHKHLFYNFHLQNPDVVSTIVKIPDFIDFLVIKENYTTDVVDFNMNDIKIMDTFCNTIVNPLYNILSETTFQEVTGVRLKLT